jgi:succinate dehydrogenase / fumarate reductase membrane anchor subunit
MAGIPLSKIADPSTHYGAPKLATRAFKVQRLTGALAVAFTGFLIWFVVRLAGAGRAEMIEVARNPLVALALIATIAVAAIHMRIGMNDVIEDYIEDHGRNRLAQLANLVFSVLVVLATIVAVGKIVFWG